MLIFVILLYSSYQDTNGTLHCDNEQKHWNGKCYNKSTAIPKNKKCYSMRNEYWCIRHATACINCQYLNSMFQSGGNNAETFHANSMLLYVNICYHLSL